MNKNEFMELFDSQDYSLFFDLANTPDLGESQEVYNKCNFCEYKTKTVHIDDVSDIDASIANHLWNEHREIAVKKAMKYRSKKIASVAGQKTLDEVEK
jgi:hypothetical protein